MDSRAKCEIIVYYLTRASERLGRLLQPASAAGRVDLVLDSLHLQGSDVSHLVNESIEAPATQALRLQETDSDSLLLHKRPTVLRDVAHESHHSRRSRHHFETLGLPLLIGDDP
jgi:hypothetical protein